MILIIIINYFSIAGPIALLAAVATLPATEATPPEGGDTPTPAVATPPGGKATPPSGIGASVALENKSINCWNEDPLGMRPSELLRSKQSGRSQ